MTTPHIKSSNLPGLQFDREPLLLYSGNVQCEKKDKEHLTSRVITQQQ